MVVHVKKMVVQAHSSKIFSCPVCNKAIITPLNLGNIFYFFQKKKCPSCSVLVKLNYLVLFALLMWALFWFVLLGYILGFIYKIIINFLFYMDIDFFVSIFLIIVLIIILVSLSIKITRMLSNIFNFRLFIKKSDQPLRRFKWN
jgi:membrane-associated HD superfamily phosphohydrolase